MTSIKLSKRLNEIAKLVNKDSILADVGCDHALLDIYLKETYHEDFGLVPLMILKANIVNSISYIGYNYLQRQGSILPGVFPP